MHKSDAGTVDRGDMLWNRKVTQPGRVSARAAVFPILLVFTRFTPDLRTDEGHDLANRGRDATVVHVPGHASGSIRILTAAGDFFCGDLPRNTRKPNIQMMDDPAAGHASVEKLNGLKIRTVYPGHGGPFPMGQFAESR